MDDNKKKKVNKGVLVASIVLVVLVLIFFLYTMLVKKEIGVSYYVVITAFLVIFWVLSNVVEVVLTKDLENRPPEQVKAYKIYALLNLVGLAGLGYFAMAIGSNSGMMGALIYVATMMAKRRYWDEYQGIKHDEDDETNEADNAEVLEADPVEDTQKELEDVADDAANEVQNAAETKPNCNE